MAQLYFTVPAMTYYILCVSQAIQLLTDPKCLLLYSQTLVTEPYPEPNESSANHRAILL